MKSSQTWVRWVIVLGVAAGSRAVVSAGPPKPATEDQIREWIGSAGDADDYDDAGLVYVLDEADVYVQDSGLATTESCHVIKVLTDAGVKAETVYRHQFDPATNRVALRSVRIHRQDGTIEDVDVSAVITHPAPEHWIYWGNQEQVLGLPRVEIGDSVEIRTSRTGYNIAYLSEAPEASSGSGETLQPPMPGHWYEVTRFSSSHPIVRKRYSVHMPKDKPVQYEVYNGELKSSVWFDGDHNVYTFEAEDIPALKREPHMVATDDCATKVVMTTVPDWQTKSRWFYTANESQFAADDAIRAKVKEITGGLKTQEEKIAACLHWVADNVRYYGTTRGPCEGFTLHKGIETFRDRGGVCKDKAGMLVTMLRVLGLEVYPALTMAGSRVEAIPADQFNHTITVMRNKDGSFRILDPTWSPLSRELWSSREALQGLVYGTPEGQSLTLSPYFKPSYNLLACRAASEIDEHGRLVTQITMDLDGYPGTYLRRNVERYPRPEQRAAFEEALHIAPNARLDNLEFTDPYDYSRNASVEMDVSANRYAAGDGAVRMFRMPLMSHPLASFFIPDLFYSFDAKERQFGMRMRATRLVRYEETVKLPAGWVVEHVPEAKTLDSESASLSFDATPGDGEFTYRFEIAVKKQIIPPEDYVEFKKAIDTMNELSDEWIVCRRETM